MKVVGINLLILGILLALMEAVFRLLGFGYGNATLDDDPLLHHVHPANYAYLSYSPSNEYGGHLVVYDGNGFRVGEENDRENPGHAPLWFVGDSYTEAAQVSWAASFPGKTGAALDSSFSVVNMGVASYSPILALLQLKKQFAAGAPDPAVVFIQLYSNDAKDDEEYAASAQFDKNDEPVSCNGGSPNAMLDFFRKFYTVRVFRRAQLTIRYFVENRRNPNQTLTDLCTGEYRELAPVIADSSRFAKSVQQIHCLLEEKCIRHYFLAIPSKYACLTGDWATPSFATNFNQFAKENGLPFLDLGTPFRAASTGGDRFFFDADIHLNEKGHDLVAREIIKTMSAPWPADTTQISSFKQQKTVKTSGIDDRPVVFLR